MPLKFQIKTYFEQNNNLNTAIDKYNKLTNCPESNTHSITNFIQGSLWKEKIISYQNKIVMPFFMYIDDVELNNPLSSISICHSLSAVYYSLCEFSKSFSANCYCRFCKAPKSIMHNLSKENSSLLRNFINYTEDLETNNFTQTGIYKDSILNQITTFHVTDNFSVDIMHDIYEGICHYNMCHLIIYYTEKIQI